jgi:hypothetical protein
MALYKIREIAYNVGYSLCNWLFPGCYWLYHIEKRVNAVLTKTRSPRPDDMAVYGSLELPMAIEGFFHSGNTFLRSNVRMEFLEKIVSHRHRPWSLKRSVSTKAPVILLIREPINVALSLHRRSLAPGRDRVRRLHVAAALMAWLGYYTYAWGLRDKLNVVTFSDLSGDYSGTRRFIETFAPGTLREQPTYEGRNSFTGERSEVQLSWFSRLILSAAQNVFLDFERYSAKERSRATRNDHVFKTL